MRVGDRRLAEQGLHVVAALGNQTVEQIVDGGIDAAHEERRDRRYRRKVAATFIQPLQPGDIGIDDSTVRFEGEDQRDIDVDALADQRLDGRNALRSGGHFNHDVGTVDVGEQASRLVNRALGIVRETGTDLERCEPVGSAGPVEHGPQQVGRVADVRDGHRLKDFASAFARLGQPDQFVVVVGRLGDGLVEDGRVRGEARDTCVDELLERARLDHGPADVVVPDRLSHIPEALNRGNHTATPPCSPAVRQFSPIVACRGFSVREPAGTVTVQSP